LVISLTKILKKEFSNMSKEVNTVGIYFVGGGGIKLGQRFSEGRQPNNNAFAKANFYFQDTSDATNKHMGDLNMYYYDDQRKGGGGVRQNVSEMVLDRVGQSLANQQPSDYNIVVHTLSGASGATIGPVLAGEIAAQGKRVISICVHNDNSQNAINNARATIATYDGVADYRETPMLTRIHTGNAKENDAGVMNDIAWLLCLFSGNHRGLDTNDIKTWMTRGSPTSPMTNRAWVLEITAGKINGNSLAVLGLATEEVAQPEGGVVGFLKVGTPDEAIIAGENKSTSDFLISDTTPVWFAIRGSTVNALAKQTEAAEQAATEMAKSFDNSRSVKSTGTKGGLVF
jgi:hypothetical protein